MTGYQTDVTRQYPKPNTYTELRRYVGMIGFFRRMIPHFADRIFLLSEMLRLQENSCELQWTPEATTQFEDSRRMLDEAVQIPHPSSTSDVYHLVTDASEYAIGSALYQLIDGDPSPVGFFSKKLSMTQQRYSTYDRELLAIYESVIHFRENLSGHFVICFTDHKPIACVFNNKTPGNTDRQERYWSVILEFVHEMDFIKG